MKNLTLTAAILAAFTLTTNAQKCCNVVDGSGNTVFASNGLCVIAPLTLASKPCEVDSDGDGILDSQDDCPETAGLAAYGGCLPPDTDGDGVTDAEDKCPNTAGTIDGCPDTDGDGIADSADECPAVAGTLNGCPDSDGDGVKDSADSCPAVAGLTALAGCPDSDSDGIADADDRCPKEAGIAANHGCPELDEETKIALKEALEGVKFQTGSDVITRASYGKLDHIVSVMETHSAYNLKISGYTDNTGDPDKNRTLSDKRAHAAEKYLISKGVDASRITAKGYGDANPIESNSTTEGRSHNRRVEFEIVFD